MAWIEVQQRLRDSHKIFLLTNKTGWDTAKSIGHVILFWLWCVDHAEDGDLRKFNDNYLAHVSGLGADEGKFFVDAMADAKFIEREPYFRVCNWWEYFGRYLKAKYKNSPEKWKSIEEMYASGESPAEVPPKSDSSSPTEPDRTEPEITEPDITGHSKTGSARRRVKAGPESVRFFGYDGLRKIFKKCNWESADDLERAVRDANATGKNISIERFMQCLVEKYDAGLRKPAGAAISTFTDPKKANWNPTDKAIRLLRDLIDPPEERSDEAPRKRLDPKYMLACKIFKAKGEAFWLENYGIGSAKELQASDEFQKLAAEFESGAA